MFELAQLRCFTMVAGELNFRRAAQRLHMTQPPLSRQIRLLEHQLGVSLFDRNTRSVTLTAAGRAFLVEARSLLDRAERATQAARRIAAGDIGSVTLGFVANAVYSLLPPVVADLRRRQPDIDLALHEMSTFEQQEALLARRIDIGIVRGALARPGVRSELLLREPFLLAVHRTHPLAERPDLRVDDLNGQDFLLYAHSAWQPFNELISGLFRSARVQPSSVQMLGSTLTILSLVNAGLGVALVPRSASAIRPEGLVFRTIALPEGVDSELHLISREDDDNPACTAVRLALHSAASQEHTPARTDPQGR